MWQQEWTNYSKITKLEQHPPDVQTSLFLHCAGKSVLKIFNTLEFRPSESKVDLQTVIQTLQVYFVGETNETFKRWHFNKREQQLHENIDDYVTWNLAKTCNFCNAWLDSLIRDRITLVIRFDGYQQTTHGILKIRQFDLKSYIYICRSL